MMLRFLTALHRMIQIGETTNFELFYLMEIKCIFYAEFDLKAGPVIKY
jgi:hypothetical protein